MTTIQGFSGPLAGLLALVANGVVQSLVERRVRPTTALLTGLGTGLAFSLIERVGEGRPAGGWGISFPRPWRRSPPPPSEPERPPPELVRVVPIAQTQIRDSVGLTLSALEAYTDHFLVRGQMVYASRRPTRGEAWWFPLLFWDARDNHDEHYDATTEATHGSSYKLLFTGVFEPALNTAAEELRLTATLSWDHCAPEALPATNSPSRVKADRQTNSGAHTSPSFVRSIGRAVARADDVRKSSSAR
jgi:hypothetical protein